MSSNTASPRYLITGYIPRIELSIIATALFGVLAIIFVARFWRTRTHKWLLALTIGTVCMTIGFGVRIPMTNDPYSLIIYIITTLFTLLSPCAFLAHNYMLLPHLASYLSADDCLFLKPRLIARTFVWIDVVVFLIQACGGGMTAIKDVKIADAGAKIALVGLIIQSIAFGTFCILGIYFAFTLRSRYPHKWSMTSSSSTYTTKPISTTKRNDWRICYFAMMISCVLFMLRCIFRVAEFAEGYSGKLRTTEWYIYVFDTLPIFLAILIWTIIWPPNYLGDGHTPLYGSSTSTTPSEESGVGMVGLSSAGAGGEQESYAGQSVRRHGQGYEQFDRK